MASSLPKTMKALRWVQAKTVEVQEIPVPSPKSGEVLVKLMASAFNRRDHWIREGMYPKIVPSTLGSDGCGVVVQASDSAGQPWVGKMVLLIPGKDWGSNPRFQSEQYTILGMPQDGTLAEYIAIAVDRLVEMPAHLTVEQ
eukprot:RCo023426